MIIVETQRADSSDTASTNTLVTDELQKLPRHLVKLVYSSLFLSLLSFIFVLVACVPNDPTLTAATILAFIFTLPHHGASILLWWLQRHQTESIFQFTPYSPRAITYSVFLILAWIASTTMCAISLNNSRNLHFVYCVFGNAPDTVPVGQQEYCTDYNPGLVTYWPSFLATLMSSLELILITSITVICWSHRRRNTLSTTSHPPSSPSITTETKVVSA